LPPGDEIAPLLSAPARFGEAMDDDFNTAAALGHLFDAVRSLNRLAPAEPSAERVRAGMFLAGYELLDPLFAVLGLLRTPSAEYFKAAGADGKMAEGEILARIESRRSARAAKQYAEADRIRKELEAAGVLLEDGKGGTTWKYKE
jgi:cysteinyl-tRNA synthetase